MMVSDVDDLCEDGEGKEPCQGRYGGKVLKLQ